MHFIIIGSGIAGCCISRLLADKGHTVDIYESNSFIGGNCHDYYDANNNLIHKYGPHIFHTSYEDVWVFLNRFSKFNKYINKVLVSIEDKLIQFPINFNSIKSLFPNNYEEFVQFITKNFKDLNSISIFDLKDKSTSKIITNMVMKIYNDIYANYTSKMWGIKIEDISPEIIKRVKINLNDDWNYFLDDKYQGLPIEGYTKMFENIIDHQNIKLHLNSNINNIIINESTTIFDNNCDHIIFTGQIDKLFNFCFGELEYRSLSIIFENYNTPSFQEVAVINYPADPLITRISEYNKMTLQKTITTTISKEIPGEYNKNSKEFNIPFYPIINEKNNDLFLKYLEKSKNYKNLILLGRLAMYKYFDMDDIVKICIDISNRF